MADDDFGIESLAAYLHIGPAQVLKLAERGNLPGRRVGGHWRFAPAEIHHWLEERMGVSTEQELEKMEDVLGHGGADDEEAISIAGLLPVEAIAVPLAARTRGSVITSMAELAAHTGWLWDTSKMAEAVRAREDMAPPAALENGVALLHPRRPLPSILGQAFLAFGRVDRALPFGAPRGGLTDLYFLICSLDDRGHLRVLARLSRLLTAPEFLSDLRSAVDSREVHELIEKYEAELS